MEQGTGVSPKNAEVPDQVKPSWQMLLASETAVCAVSGGTTLAEILFDAESKARDHRGWSSKSKTAANRLVETLDAGSLFPCYSGPGQQQSGVFMSTMGHRVSMAARTARLLPQLRWNLSCHLRRRPRVP
jgi:hypothetical protein